MPRIPEPTSSDPAERIEQALGAAVAKVEADGAPPRLAAAIRYALFPGGARLRPKLCLAVAHACGDDAPRLTAAAAAAIEMLHCASLVHDDLPCFDDAPVRRGKPSVHRAFGEPLALLAGDALIIAAFETLAAGAVDKPARLPALLRTVAQSVGMPHGITAGQAWESEPGANLADYQRAKTGALFAGATGAGAATAGADPSRWLVLGERLGEAYQVVDDLRDLVADPNEIGKPIGRDATLGRPNAALQLGVDGALRRLEALVGEAVNSIPPCPGESALKALIDLEARRFLPKELAARAA